MGRQMQYRPDHPWPLRKHPVWSRNKRWPNLLYRWILRRLPGAVRRPCLPLRACPGERSGWPAQRPWRRTPRAVSGQRDLGRSRAVRCLLRGLERRSLLTHTSDALPFGSVVTSSCPCTPTSNRAAAMTINARLRRTRSWARNTNLHCGAICLLSCDTRDFAAGRAHCA